MSAVRDLAEFVLLQFDAVDAQLQHGRGRTTAESVAGARGLSAAARLLPVHALRALESTGLRSPQALALQSFPGLPQPVRAQLHQLYW